MISVKLALDRQLFDDDLLERTVHRVRRKLAYLLDDLHAFLHLPEYRVLAVEPRRRHERYEELRAAGVPPVPLPFGQPPWIMNSSMTRWKVSPS